MLSNPSYRKIVSNEELNQGGYKRNYGKETQKISQRVIKGAR